MCVGGLVMSPNSSSGWGVFDPVQAVRKPEISASGQVITESLILINKYWHAQVIWSLKAVRSYLILQLVKIRLGICFKGEVWCLAYCCLTLPSRWAGEAAEWPASTDPPVRPWCSAGQSLSDRKRCSLRTSPSSAQKTNRKQFSSRPTLLTEVYLTFLFRFGVDHPFYGIIEKTFYTIMSLS